MISGTSITRESKDFIPAEARLRPLGDRIIVKPLDDNLSESIVAIRYGRPLRGKALAVGPGAYRIRYKQSEDKRFKLRIETNDFIPTTVKVGDVVYFGGLNIFDGNSYIFEEITWGYDKCLVITERDVCFIEETKLKFDRTVGDTRHNRKEAARKLGYDEEYVKHIC